MKIVIAFTAWILWGVAVGAVPTAFTHREEALEATLPLATIRKDKFEATREYHARLCPAVLKALNARSGEFVDIPLMKPLDYSMNYDADRQRFSVRITDAYPNVYDNSSLDKYVGIDIADSGRHPRHGRLLDLAGWQVDEVVVLIPTPKNLAVGDDLIKTSIRADPTLARKLDGDMQLILSTKIEAPCFVTGTRLDGRLDDPRTVAYELYGIVGSRDTRWRIIRKSSGEVLKSGKF